MIKISSLVTGVDSSYKIISKQNLSNQNLVGFWDLNLPPAPSSGTSAIVGPIRKASESILGKFRIFDLFEIIAYVCISYHIETCF